MTTFSVVSSSKVSETTELNVRKSNAQLLFSFSGPL